MLRLGVAAMVGVGGLAALVACSNEADLGGAASVDSGSTETSSQSLCTVPTAEPTCEAAVDVATADEAAAVIAALTERKYTSTKTDSGASLKPSRDVRATAAIELDVTRFRGSPASCRENDPDCRETWAFSSENTAAWRFATIGRPPERPLPAGVLCGDASCSKIAIAAGTVVRFQRALEVNGFAGLYQHYVRVVRPCTVPCAGDELRCTDSTTCLAAKSFCTLCEGQPNDLCACRDGCSGLAEAAPCTYQDSDDTRRGRACTAGACK